MHSPYQVKHKPAKRRSNGSGILILLVLFSLIFAGFIYAFIWQKAAPKKEVKPASPYPAIHAEDLGKTPAELKKTYPDLFLSTDRSGNLVGRHKLNGAHYFIWFVAENGEKQAFRIKANKQFPSLEEEDVLNYFGSYFGRPFDGSCSGKITYAMDNCHFKWWVRKSISLDLYSRRTSKDKILLSVVTTDTYLSSKHHDKVKSVLPVQ